MVPVDRIGLLYYDRYMATIGQDAGEKPMYEQDAEEAFALLTQDSQTLQLLSTELKDNPDVAQKLHTLAEHNAELFRLVANLRSQAGGAEFKSEMFAAVAQLVR